MFTLTLFRLLVLQVGRNYITDEAATASVEVLTRMEGVRLKQLDLSVLFTSVSQHGIHTTTDDNSHT